MANRRMLTSDIFSDDIFMELDDVTRLLWIGLITICADDQGRFQNNDFLIKSQVFPADRKSPSRILKSLQILEEKGMIFCYKKDGKSLAQIVNWWKHQAPSWAAASLYPAPDGWTDRVKVNSKGNKVLMENWTEQGGFMEVHTKVHTQVPTAVGTEVPDQVVFKVKDKVKDKVKNKGEEKEKNDDDVSRIFSAFETELRAIMTPSIRDEILVMLDDGIPADWFVEAFKLSAEQSKHFWAYPKKILNNWQTDGFKSGGRKAHPESEADKAGKSLDDFRMLVRMQQESMSG